MKKFRCNEIAKKLILSIILIIMIGNFIMPNTVQALSGGTLAKPIFQFIAWIGDQVLNFLQINVEGGIEIGSGSDPNITYTLGNIFANKIAIFDVNFIEPNSYDKTYSESHIKEVEGASGLSGVINDYGLSWGPTPIESSYEGKVDPRDTFF